MTGGRGSVSALSSSACHVRLLSSFEHLYYHWLRLAYGANEVICLVPAHAASEQPWKRALMTAHKTTISSAGCSARPVNLILSVSQRQKQQNDVVHVCDTFSRLDKVPEAIVTLVHIAIDFDGRYDKFSS